MNDHKDVANSRPRGQVAVFCLPDGVTLEVHIPGATEVRTAPSPSREAGFILRSGEEIMNIGPLGAIVRR